MFSPMAITLIILVLAVISFLLEKIPVNLTIMLSMIALVAFGIVDAKTAVSGFASNTILMLIGLVIVGGALFETGICDMIAQSVTRFAKTERMMIMAIMLLSAILSAGLSNSGTVAVFIKNTARIPLALAMGRKCATLLFCAIIHISFKELRLQVGQAI